MWGGGWGSTKVGTTVEHEWSAEWSDGGGDLAKESGKNVLHLPSPNSHVSAVSERVRRAHSTPALQPPSVRAQCNSATWTIGAKLNARPSATAAGRFADEAGDPRTIDTLI